MISIIRVGPLCTLVLCLFLFFLNLKVYSQDHSIYKYFVNLNETDKNKVEVQLNVPNISTKEVIFNFPKIVPGIYGPMNFGRNVEKLVAWDRRGKTLPTERMDDNSWRIKKANKLHHISYQVKEGWESLDTEVEEGNFKATASSFEKDKFFVINNNSLFGYFEGKENVPFQIVYEKPGDFFGASTLKGKSISRNEDHFQAENYQQLVDSPILYARPDTANFQIANVKVTVAAYSDSGIGISKEIANHLRPLMENQKEYLGGHLPVDHYMFQIFHNTAEVREDGGTTFLLDGQEHGNSTLILMNSGMDYNLMKEVAYEVASHEFFHILSPLNLHSDAIGAFDFMKPKPSKHLWLYEGMTEYTAMHMAVKQRMKPLQSFLNAIERKVQQMNEFDNTISLTDLSVKVMDKQDQIYNFYLRGALMNLCLDIRLRELSKGKYGTQELMNELSLKYGKDKPFDENQIFDEIVQLTFEEIGEFFNKYVEGSEPLPLQEFLANVGIVFNPENQKLMLSKNPTDEQLQLRRHWINN